MEATKTAIRQAMRARRRALDAAEQHAAARAVAVRLAALPAFRQAPAVLAYLACDGELPTEPLLAAAAAAGKRLYLPRLIGDAMRFAPYALSDALRTGRFGISEPPRAPAARAEWADALALVPLLAWDSAGGRVGRGGGHYDRAFAAPHRPRWLIGVAYAFQQVAHVPSDTWDLRLDGIVTERGSVTCRPRGGEPQLRKEDRDDHEQRDVDTGQRRAGGRSGLRAGRPEAPAI